MRALEGQSETAQCIFYATAAHHGRLEAHSPGSSFASTDEQARQGFGQLAANGTSSFPDQESDCNDAG